MPKLSPTNPVKAIVIGAHMIDLSTSARPRLHLCNGAIRRPTPTYLQLQRRLHALASTIAYFHDTLREI